MEFRECVGTQELHCVFVRKCVEYANYQEVEAKHVQFVLRTKDVGRVRLTQGRSEGGPGVPVTPPPLC